MQLSGYIKLIILLLCLFSLSGCVTFDDYYAHIAGTRIYDITKAKSDGGFPRYFVFQEVAFMLPVFLPAEQ